MYDQACDISYSPACWIRISNIGSLRIRSNINTIYSTILVLKYFRGKIRHWLQRHDRLYKLSMYRTRRGITSHLRGLPDFVIIGAQKCGTTSLYHFVVKHPAIVPAHEKEIEYFMRRYRLGEQWYRSNFPTKMSKYYFYKKTGQKFLSGEASSAYIFYPMVPDRMKEILFCTRILPEAFTLIN